MKSPRKALGAVLLGALLAGCTATFPFSETPNSETIYRTAVNLYNEGKVASAVLGFRRLSETLGPQDPLLPRTQWYLGQALLRQKEYLSAAEAFHRIHIVAPGDTLADDGMLAAARAYRREWPNPELDSSYGEAARDELDRMLTLYPNTPLAEDVFRELQGLTNAFAEKDYQVGMGYWRQRSYHSAIQYFRDVVELYPTSERARDARLMIVRSYQRLDWSDNAREECVVLRQMYANDPEVRSLCGLAAALTPQKE
jgi:outer membrane protein assembly factor BamD